MTEIPGTFLVVQWLRLCLPVQWVGSLGLDPVWVGSLVGELRFHMPGSQKTKI